MIVIFYIIFCGALAIVSTVGDIVILHSYFKTFPLLRAVWDNATHGLVAVICWMLTCGKFSCVTAWKESLLCGVIACAVDVDHFIAAGSVKIKDVTNLKNRPFLHCTSVVLFVVVLLTAMAKLRGQAQLYRLGVIAFAAVFSHHLRDALRRGLWMWPYGSTPPVRLEVYYFGLVSLAIVCAFATRTSVSLAPSKHFDRDAALVV